MGAGFIQYDADATLAYTGAGDVTTSSVEWPATGTDAPKGITINKAAASAIVTLNENKDISAGEQPIVLTQGILSTATPIADPTTIYTLTVDPDQTAGATPSLNSFIAGRLAISDPDAAATTLYYPMGVVPNFGSEPNRLADVRATINAAMGLGDNLTVTALPYTFPLDPTSAAAFSTDLGTTYDGSQMLPTGWNFTRVGSLPPITQVEFNLSNSNASSADVEVVSRDASRTAGTWARFLSGSAAVYTRSGTNVTVDFIPDLAIVPGFFTFYSFNAAVTLPVQLISFDARRAGDVVDLTWTTGSEVNNSHFEVQRAVDTPSNWEVIGTVQGQGTTSATTNYQFTDPALGQAANRLFYRLRQVDLDGTASFSPIEEVGGSQRWNVRPNPVSADFDITSSTPYNPSERVFARLTSLSGQVLLSTSNELVGLNNAIRGVVNRQPSGIYLLHLQSDTGAHTLRIVKP